jgi:hypothetical protein
MVEAVKASVKSAKEAFGSSQPASEFAAAASAAAAAAISCSCFRSSGEEGQEGEVDSQESRRRRLRPQGHLWSDIPVRTILLASTVPV